MMRGVLAACLLLTIGAGPWSVRAWGADPSSVTLSPIGAAEQVPATLMTPDGPGPFPAVVVMHDCSGLGPGSSAAPQRWAAELVRQGYVVLVPDSFTPRGLAAGVCTEPPARARVANGYVRAADAYGALAFLRTLPIVDGRHIGIMGGSHGGWTTLAAMYEPVLDTNPLITVKRDGFAAAIALYPSCTGPYGSWSTTRANGDSGPAIAHAGVYKPIAPVLILIGAKDDWTPAEPCQWLVETAKAQGYPIDIKVYPGARHSFDSDKPVRYSAQRTNLNARLGYGATTGGDPDAWADARRQVSAFFARHLKPDG